MLEIKNNTLYISPENWKALNNSFTKEEIKEQINNFIDSNNIQFPYKENSESDASSDFLDLVKLNEQNLILKKDCFTRYKYKYWQKPNFIIPICKTGNIASDYFHNKTRMDCDSINAPSPTRSWYGQKFRDGLLNSFWTLKVDKIDQNTILQCIALRKYIASQFRPSAAKFIYNYFGSENVLDFSSGWGDRLCGFYASNAISYTGIDPNSNLINNYNNQINLYKTLNNEKIINIINSPAEDYFINKMSFDTVFTSPPYFNIERYSKDDNQSYKRYKKLDIWLNEFLFKTIYNSWESLKPNGVLAINISDVYSGHTINNICDPMNDYISNLKNSKYWGIIGYQMAKRPNSKANQHGIFVEPIWVWRKNGE